MRLGLRHRYGEDYNVVRVTLGMAADFFCFVDELRVNRRTPIAGEVRKLKCLQQTVHDFSCLHDTLVHASKNGFGSDG